jgi:hypothetical protein
MDSIYNILRYVVLRPDLLLCHAIKLGMLQMQCRVVTDANLRSLLIESLRTKTFRFQSGLQ